MKQHTDISALITEGESQTVGFKTSFVREAIETLVAFANTQGGRVLFGVSDNGEIVGVFVGKETINQWLGQVKSATFPALIPDVEVVGLAEKTLCSSRLTFSHYLTSYENVLFYKGLFPSTADPIKNINFSFVHLDVDLYEATFASIEFFYPGMHKEVI